VTKTYDFLLYGGAGYLGTHLADALRVAGYSVAVQDRQVEIGPDWYHVDEPAPAFDHMIHLACPRNKPGTWNARAAEEALEAGRAIADFGTDCNCWFISSMSVYDEPDNQYASFKRMAEKIVLQRENWGVVRLPTLLGAEEGLVYRADLGLHQIAATVARGKQPSATLKRRFVLPIRMVVERLVKLFTEESLSDTPIEIHSGAIPFYAICPDAEPTAAGTYAAPDSAVSMSLPVLSLCRAAFCDLVDHIKHDRVRAI
jgi:nucleoside-diphosphate-sugar epimerase